MKIHKSDPKDIASRGCKSWKEIMEMVRQRAIDRAEVLPERKAWNTIQNAAQESWE